VVAMANPMKEVASACLTERKSAAASAATAAEGEDIGEMKKKVKEKPTRNLKDEARNSPE
jgi:hypothetical protein